MRVADFATRVMKILASLSVALLIVVSAAWVAQQRSARAATISRSEKVVIEH
jgi:hypothetical protein